jgi:flagellin
MSQFPTSTLGLQTLSLLRDQIISSALMDGESLDEFILSALLGSSSTQSSGREKSAGALSGRMRGDAGMFRAASRNMAEAGTIATMARKGANSVKDALTEMQSLAQGVADGSMSAVDAQSAYMDLANSITGTMKSTAYNGINLLDSSTWGADERLDYNAVNGTAAISIQAGAAPTTLTLRDMELGTFAATDLNDAAAAAATATRLSGLTKNVETIESGYEGMAARFSSERKHFSYQSAVLESSARRAVDEAGAGNEPDMKSLLLDFILKNSGRIVDSAS